LAGEPWDGIYASDLSRARETASIIGERLGIDALALDRRLRERGFGEAEGMDSSERKLRFPDGDGLPGAEPWDEVRRRGLLFLEELVRGNRGKRLLVVSHGGLLMSILSHLSDGGILPGRSPLRNLSMSRLLFDGSWRIDSFNRVAPELEDEAVSA
jgi:broad specificity phosphatase PhoE